MGQPAYLVLDDGSIFQGESLGARGWTYGQVVFNTSMTGYQEMLTDPSYAGQLLVLTYPLIGNYGVNPQDVESRHVQAAGLVAREVCTRPSHGSSTATLYEYLASQGVTAISGVDTRALTRRLRAQGVRMGAIATELSPGEALERLRALPPYDNLDFVKEVSVDELYRWDQPLPGSTPLQQPWCHIVVSDWGLKYNILRSLRALGCAVSAVPATASANDILAINPDGVVLSPGPGDPALLNYLAETTRGLVGRLPIMGICLGHQVLARAFGSRTFKLKFGHRGGNHPVKDLTTGRVYITAQNHGYAVDPDSLPPDLQVSHVSLNDGTVEGLRHPEMPILTIQYHAEASPGPQDNQYLFERFLAMVKSAGPGTR